MDFENIQQQLSQIASNFDMLSFLKFMLIASFAVFLVGLILRVVCGKKSSLNKSVAAAIGILMIYVVFFAMHSTKSAYHALLAPLPFVGIAGDYLTIFQLQGAGASAVCTELVNMMILAFLIGIVDDIVPDGENFFTWLFFRTLSLVLGMAVHWGSNYLFTTYLPGFIVTYAPVVLMILVVVLLAVTVFKLIVGVLLGVTLSPVIGAIYTFFVSNIIGKQITRAALTTLILTAMVYALNYFGITAIYLASAAIAAFLPALIAVILVWYLVFKFL